MEPFRSTAGTFHNVSQSIMDVLLVETRKKNPVTQYLKRMIIYLVLEASYHLTPPRSDILHRCFIAWPCSAYERVIKASFKHVFISDFKAFSSYLLTFTLCFFPPLIALSTTYKSGTWLHLNNLLWFFWRWIHERGNSTAQVRSN